MKHNGELGIGTEAWVSRHADKGQTDTESYPDLSPAGVEKARERAYQMVDLVRTCEPGSVIFIGGFGEMRDGNKRTGSTLKVYVDTLEDALQSDKDVLVFGREYIRQSVGHSGFLTTAKALQEIAVLVPKVKVVIGVPLHITDLTKKEWWYDEAGQVRHEQEKLLAKHGKNYSDAIKEWFGHGGEINGEQKLAQPKVIAESYIQGIARLENFVSRFAGDRPLKIVMNGHSFEIDALLTYLANNGQVTTEGFNKIGGQVIDNTEMAVIESYGQDGICLKYRDKEFVFVPDITSGDKISS